jgi:DNA-binding response OmpR family regulator
MSETQTLTAVHAPMVYFIDDSATMREVIKIAFRKENIKVTTCPDAATALQQFEQSAPDIVITDVIMPDRDGYEVCRFIKQHDRLGKTPVILMSGVVNKSVAEKAMAVNADELIRKPFQPQELIARVKNLLNPRSSTTGSSRSTDAGVPARDSAQVLSSLFAPTSSPALPRASAPQSAPTTFTPAAHRPTAPRPTAAASPSSSAELQKLRAEVNRLELLVKKLRAELQAGHEYCEALESQLKALQETQ